MHSQFLQNRSLRRIFSVCRSICYTKSNPANHKKNALKNVSSHMFVRIKCRVSPLKSAHQIPIIHIGVPACNTVKQKSI